MRGKEVLARIIPARAIRLVWTRLTLNRTTTLYVSASFILAFTQIPLQVAVHSVNRDARLLINELLQAANISPTELVAVLTRGPPTNSSGDFPDSRRLEVCRATQGDEDLDDCVIVWADGGILQADGTYGEAEDEKEDEEEEEEEEEDGAEEEESDDENESVSSGDDSLDGEDSDSDDEAENPNVAARGLPFYRTPRSPTSRARPLPYKRSVAPRPRREPSARPRRSIPFIAEIAAKRALALPDPNQLERRILPVQFWKRDKLVAEPLFDSGITGTVISDQLNKPSFATGDDEVEEEDDDALTNIVGLHLTDPAADGSLKLVSTAKEASDRGVFDVVKVADVGDISNAANIEASFNNPLTLEEATVPRACALSLLYPSSVLHDSEREDLSLLVFHLWLFLLHLVGVLNESVVYIIVSFGGSLMAVGWSIGTLVRTAHFHGDFDRLIASGACGGVHVIPNWYMARVSLEIPVLVIGAISLILMSVLSWMLIKVYGWQTFKRVGARMDLSRMYKVMITFSVCIQTAAFFVPLSLFLWLDNLQDGAIVSQANHLELYRGVSAATVIFVLPWLILGWLCVRRERPLYTYVFLAITAAILAVLLGFYGSPMYLFTVQEWPFFAFTTSISVLFVVFSFALGVWCRLNYGNGLLEALKETEMQDDADQEPWKLVKGEGQDLYRTDSHSTRRNVLSMGGDLEKQSWASNQSHSNHGHSTDANPFADPEVYKYPMEIEKSKTLGRAASATSSKLTLEPPNRRVLTAVNADPFVDFSPVVASMPTIPPPAVTTSPMPEVPNPTSSRTSESTLNLTADMFGWPTDKQLRTRTFQSMATTVSEGTIASWVAGDEAGMSRNNTTERRQYGLPSSIRPPAAAQV